MLKISFIVPFVQGKGRPRFVIRGGFAQAYTPKETKVAEQAIQKIAKPLFPQPFIGPIEVNVKYHLFRSEKTFQRGPRKGLTEKKVPRKIDTDNVLKLVKDALNGIAYIDDFQVRKDICEYFFVASKEQEKTEVTIIALNEALESEEVS